MSNLTLSAEATLGAYPERHGRSPGPLDRLAARAVAPMLRRRSACQWRWRHFPTLVGRHGPALSRLGDDAIRDAARTLGWELRTGGYGDDLVARAFALVRVMASRTLGERHFDVQLVGGRVLLAGLGAEMETGEGQTLTATLAACTPALAGIPLPILTVNDYLPGRDAERMGPIYRGDGVTVRVVTHGKDHQARRAGFQGDVT